MSLTIPVSVSQTTVAVAALLAGALFGVGYISGRYAEHSANRQQIERLNSQLMRTNEAYMQAWIDTVSTRYRHPPDAQEPLVSADAE